MLDQVGMLLNAIYSNFPGSGGMQQREVDAPQSGGGQGGGSYGAGSDWWGLGPERRGSGGDWWGLGPQRDGMMGGGGPTQSQMPGSRYKTRGSAPRYHEEAPMGGTPGVWAIRNDEIGGPRSDAQLDYWKSKYGGGGRFRRFGL